MLKCPLSRRLAMFANGAVFLKQYIQAMRLFKDEPKWTPLNRSEDLDANEHRQTYVSQYLN